MQGGQQDDEAAEDEEEGILEGGVRGSAGVCVSIRADWLFRLGGLARVFQGWGHENSQSCSGRGHVDAMSRTFWGVWSGNLWLSVGLWIRVRA